VEIEEESGHPLRQQPEADKPAKKKWQRLWVLQPNAAETGDIWIQRWVREDNISYVQVPQKATTAES
jgi:hypothetical protein